MKKTKFQKLAKNAQVLSKTQLTKIKGGSEGDAHTTGIGDDDIEAGITNVDLMEL